MSTKDYDNATIWGIHGGKTGDADNIFLKKNQVALGWDKVGDLAALKATRDDFKKRIQEVYPDMKPGYYSMATGQLFRFAHEMKDSDLIIYPSKQDKRVYIGEITGPYQYLTKSADTYPHRRPVKWIKNFPRTKFTQGALYVISAPLSFFQVKKHADEFLLALVGKGLAQETIRDETITYTAEDLNKDTKDSDLKMQSQELKGNGLAKVVYLKIFLLFLIIVAASIWFLGNT